MAFKIQVKKPNGEVIWTRQWSAPPTDEQISQNTIEDGVHKGGLFRHAHEVYRAIRMIRDDSTLNCVSELGGLEVYRA